MYLGKNKKEEGVVVLITILSVGLFAIGLALTLALNTTSQVVKNRNLSTGDQLFYTADAQAREAAYQFLNSADPGDFEEGDTFTVGNMSSLNDATSQTITITDYTWPYYEITSKASNDII
ncbi:MAG: hypothetical protein R3251_03575, partial [Candidatus Spechtbacterales bacterium]|nr:hypothetical protein [Candidatus Spechtbacterales bacterium]